MEPVGYLCFGAFYMVCIWLYNVFLGSYWVSLLNGLRTPQILKHLLNIGLVYAFTCLAWIFFRATDFENALQVISGLGNLESFNFGQVTNKFWVIKGYIIDRIFIID